MEVEHWHVVVDLILTLFNDLLSNFDIKFVPSISIELSGNDFDDLNWVIFSTEESFWSILRNENGVVILLMTGPDEPFSGVDEASKI